MIKEIEKVLTKKELVGIRAGEKAMSVKLVCRWQLLNNKLL